MKIDFDMLFGRLCSFCLYNWFLCDLFSLCFDYYNQWKLIILSLFMPFF